MNRLEAEARLSEWLKLMTVDTAKELLAACQKIEMVHDNEIVQYRWIFMGTLVATGTLDGKYSVLSCWKFDREVDEEPVLVGFFKGEDARKLIEGEN